MTRSIEKALIDSPDSRARVKLLHSKRRDSNQVTMDFDCQPRFAVKQNSLALQSIGTATK
jgi:hypothetical protein